MRSKDRLSRVDIPIPNPALAEWLRGSECRTAMQRVTSEIFTAYHNALPEAGSVSRTGYVRTGQLKRSAYWRVDLGTDWGRGGPRWFGYVGNTAPYAAVIEYGKNGRGGQGQLRRAVAKVTGDLLSAASVATGGDIAAGFNNPIHPGVTFDSHTKRYRDSSGRFIKKPG